MKRKIFVILILCFATVLLTAESLNIPPFIGTYGRETVGDNGKRISLWISFGAEGIISVGASTEEEEDSFTLYYGWTPKTICTMKTKGGEIADSFMYSMTNGNKTIIIKGMDPDLDGEYTRK